MAIGKRKQCEEPLWHQSDPPEAPGHPFYQRPNRVLDEEAFNRFCEGRRFLSRKAEAAETTSTAVWCAKSSSASKPTV
jgi:hypothetical protein